MQLIRSTSWWQVSTELLVVVNKWAHSVTGGKDPYHSI